MCSIEPVMNAVVWIVVLHQALKSEEMFYYITQQWHNNINNNRGIKCFTT
jgi:hypothetical protein